MERTQPDPMAFLQVRDDTLAEEKSCCCQCLSAACIPCFVSKSCVWICCCSCLRKPTRPTWNRTFDFSVAMLRHTIKNAWPKNPRFLRMVSDWPIPMVGVHAPLFCLLTLHVLQFVLPSGIKQRRVTIRGSVNLSGEWTFPIHRGLPQQFLHDSAAVPDCFCGCCGFDCGSDPPPDSDIGRVVLYFHGGAYCVCAANTHRQIIFPISKLTVRITHTSPRNLLSHNPTPRNQVTLQYHSHVGCASACDQL
jgi:hypothetical protein